MGSDIVSKRPYVRRTGTKAEKHAANTRRWRRKNPDKNWANVMRAANRVRVAIIDAKDSPCVDCDVQYPSYVMDFDHVRGEKLFDIGHSAINRGLKATLAEIAKCEVVCANCHRERSHRRSKRFHK